MIGFLIRQVRDVLIGFAVILLLLVAISVVPGFEQALIAFNAWLDKPSYPAVQR